jgi:hypothetical protein
MPKRPEGPVLDVPALNAELRERAERLGCRLIEAPVWDEKECGKRARYVARDGYGTRDHWTGHVQAVSQPMERYGFTAYEGHKIGTVKLWPELDPGYELVLVQTWGIYIRKKET